MCKSPANAIPFGRISKDYKKVGSIEHVKQRGWCIMRMRKPMRLRESAWGPMKRSHKSWTLQSKEVIFLKKINWVI